MRSVNFSPDSKRVVSGSIGKSIKVWKYERTIRLTSPTGGETFAAGSTQTITWTSQNVSSVKIEYSINSGTSWSLVANSVAASLGSYSWLVPNQNSAQCKIRITDTDSTKLQAISLNTFSITYLPVINITSPIGGEKWVAHISQNITWTSQYVQKVKIEYTTNNGATWIKIADSTSASIGTYVWMVPNTPSSNCKILITDLYDQNVKAESPYSFSIYPSVVTVTSPVGGEKWKAGSKEYITWTSIGVTNVKIEFSPDGGNVWTTIINSTPTDDGGYLWTVQSQSSNNCRIRISDASDSSINDISGSAFTIYRPTILVISPNGGEIWVVNDYKTIQWISSYSSNVKIQYSVDSGSSWQTIINSISADAGKFIWQIPNTVSEQCKVKITDADDASISDISDAVFVISPAVGVEKGISLPTTYRLDQNYPNPFNPSTSIEYSVPSTGMVTLKVYDLLGRKVATLVNEIKQAGNYNVQLSTYNYQLTTGIYFYKLTAGTYSSVRKMILMK